MRVSVRPRSNSSVKIKFVPGLVGDTGETGSAGPTGATGPALAGATLFVSRASIEGATIDAGIKSTFTDAYATPGDMGGTRYKRRATTPFPLFASGTDYTFSGMFVINSLGLNYQLERDPGAGVAATVEPTHTIIGQTVQGADGYGWTRVRANTAYVRSLDRFKADGTEDATHGGWWQLVVQGELLIEQLGGVGDAPLPDGLTGTDNWDALTDAFAFVGLRWPGAPGQRYTHRIRFSAGGYRFTKGFSTNWQFSLTGVEAAGAAVQSPTWLFFPQTVDPFVFNNAATYGSSSVGGSGRGESTGSTFENFTILGGGGLGVFTNIARCMIKVRATMTIRNLALFNIPGRGIWQKGGGGDGNCNNWHAENIVIHEAGHHYFHTEGSDANGGYAKGIT